MNPNQFEHSAENTNPSSNDVTPVGQPYGDAQQPTLPPPEQPIPQPQVFTSPDIPPTPAIAQSPYARTPPSGLPPISPAAPTTNPGLIVLQWLTYAFWGWTILGLSILTVTVLASMIKGADTGGFTPYGIAAILVLLPISYACDMYYTKHEPIKKTGAAVWVMVIHAVIFALFGIGALIYTVISLVQIFVESSDHSTAVAGLISALIITVFYALTFLRTLHPASLARYVRFYKMIMLISVGVIALLGLIGPVATERATRNDRLISNNLDALSQKIDDYAQSKNRLPNQLSDLSLSGDMQQLADKDLVTYKPESSAPTTTQQNLFGNTDYSSNSQISLNYQLCVTYTKKSTDYDRYGSNYSNSSSDGYSTAPDAYSHPAGNVCYKLKTYDN